MKHAVLILLASCGGAPPLEPLRTAEDAPALDALRDANFDGAIDLATKQLALAPHDAEAAGIRALASYVHEAIQANTQLKIEHAWFIIDHFFDPESQPVLVKLEQRLDAIDRDLEIASADPRFSFELCLACWKYDWNNDGVIDQRDTQLFEVEQDDSGHHIDASDPRRRPVFRFDAGDIQWARAMLAFQRAGLDIVLAYRWADGTATKTEVGPTVIHLIAPDRVKHARALVLAGLEFSDAARKAYLAETDDDREWVPNPHQKSHGIPLEADDQLYATWDGVLGDVRNLVNGRTGIGMRDAMSLLGGRKDVMLAPDAYVDIGRMFSEPTDITFVKDPDERGDEKKALETWLRGALGHGYADHMDATPLVRRLAAMKSQLERGSDTLEHKLHYLLWIN